MARHKKRNSWIYITIILAIALLLLLFYGCRHDWFAGNVGSGDGNGGGGGGTPPNNQPTPQYTCYDSDGGINWDVSGYCEDSFHEMGFSDSCSDKTEKEYYCDSNNVCQFQTQGCKFNEICAGGRCQAMPCNLIRPAVASNCDNGYCASGTCHFVAGGVVTPNRCEC